MTPIICTGPEAYERSYVETEAWVLETAGAPPVYRTVKLDGPGDDEVVVSVMACGLCHTDLGFADGSVSPRHGLPLVLGHEITGVVGRTGKNAAGWRGRAVMVPSVISCGDCAFCRRRRGNICPNQKMPGNDIHGGFARHVVVPARALIAIPDASGLALDALAVVADAVSTAYQAVERAGIARGDVAFVIGAGGVGGFIAQIARARGAHVIACDVAEARLETLGKLGVDHTTNVRDRDARDIRRELHARARDWGVASLQFRIFECSGTPSGQKLAFTLLAPAATLVLVGFTREAVDLRLSNLMAFDATIHGTWGCPLEAYPAVLDLVQRKQVLLEPFIERAPMSELPEHLAALREHRLVRRLVLDPRA
jgi:6-hydroxycyclohex-1-ene-1-carbonyl-CoA dehydrogenase